VLRVSKAYSCYLIQREDRTVMIVDLATRISEVKVTLLRARSLS